MIAADPKMRPEDKERTIRAFATAIRDITDYIPGPDMGTDEMAMAWVHDEIRRAVGLPRELESSTGASSIRRASCGPRPRDRHRTALSVRASGRWSSPSLRQYLERRSPIGWMRARRYQQGIDHHA